MSWGHRPSPRGKDERLLTRGHIFVVLALLFHVGTVTARAEELQVRIRDGQSLRDIAREQLGDPDLWPEILRANGLASPTEVKPGMTLIVPAGEIGAADRALREALAAIQEATGQGARLFAPQEIELAIARYDAGVAGRKAGDWAAATAAAAEARHAAAAAMQLAAQSRDTVAEARLTDREGLVEGRTPQELVWSDRLRGAILIEDENLRTLSRSSAQITFRDDSRLRLSANSQAVIRRMRADLLSRTEEAKVTLVEGDFYALLSGKSERRKFELEVPNVETDVDSRSFWVRRDDSGSKFTNFDDGLLRVAAHGSEVALGRNEATLVREGRQPLPKVDILPPVSLGSPADDSQTLAAAVTLGWQPVADAVGYWLELAFDPGFQQMRISRWGLKEASFATGELDVGTYYWRIAALDKFGLPGDRGEVWRFHVRVDATPPFLVVTEPAEEATITRSPLVVRGETEPGARLLVNGAAVELDAEGRFALEVEAGEGAGELTFEAADAAGNVTRRSRAFRYVPGAEALLDFDPGIPSLSPRHFVTRRDVISLTGTTRPGAQLLLQVAGQPLREATYAGGDGRFTLNVPVPGETVEYTVRMVQRSGLASEDRFTVSIDREPPGISLELPPPTVTAVEWLPLRGTAPGATSLAVNGRPVRLIGERFDETLTLVGGQNTIRLEAVDLVGNARVESFDVQLDQLPPELVGYQVTPRQARPGEPIQVEVRASDPSGLRQAAAFRLRVAGAEYGDFLKLAGDGSTYRATMILPREAVGPVSLREVELEDYAGNRERFAIER
jgi:hypothetical protein